MSDKFDRMKQVAMFTNGQDLPLFSGTAQRGTVNAFTPQPVSAQTMIPAACGCCLDTGKVDGKFCTCATGQALRGK